MRAIRAVRTERERVLVVDSFSERVHIRELSMVRSPHHYTRGHLLCCNTQASPETSLLYPLLHSASPHASDDIQQYVINDA